MMSRLLIILVRPPRNWVRINVLFDQLQME